MLEIPMTTMLLSASLLAVAPSQVPMAQPAAVGQDLPDNQALLPVAAVFFLPKISWPKPPAGLIPRQSFLSGPTMTAKLARPLRQHFCGAMRCAMN
jgi:hypothetical protein